MPVFASVKKEAAMIHGILIVEDNPEQMKCFCKMLETTGNYKIFQADNTFQAKKILKLNEIEIVLCGISVSNALKNWGYQEKIKEQQIKLEKMKIELETSEEQFRSIFENIQEGFYQAGLDGKIIMANPVAVKMMGYNSFDEVNGSDMTGFYQNPEDRIKLLGEMKRYGAVTAYEIGIKRKDGSNGTILVNTHLRKDRDGIVLGVEGTFVDITDFKQLESDLFQAQKLESIGQLAAGIAHEINTPIQYIGDNINFISNAFEDLSGVIDNFKSFLRSVKQEEADKQAIEDMDRSLVNADLDFLRKEVPEAISQSLEGVECVSKIVRSMKEFSHPGKEERVMADIHHAIENTMIVTKNEWKYVADIVTDFDDSMPRISCHPGEINQVLSNMIINAAHAIAEALGNSCKEKGRITIQTKDREKFIEILISDTGAGIPKQVMNKIFDPFFTTKELGKGTGQGLSISHSIIVEKHGGSIKFHPRAGRGTTFIISLPKNK